MGARVFWSDFTGSWCIELPSGYVRVATTEEVASYSLARLSRLVGEIRQADDLSTLPTDVVLSRIEALQDVQKRHPNTSAEWQTASEFLRPLFSEMARRTRRGRRGRGSRRRSSGRDGRAK